MEGQLHTNQELHHVCDVNLSDVIWFFFETGPCSVAHDDVELIM